MQSTRLSILVALLGLVALVAAGCGSSSATAVSSAAPAAGAADGGKRIILLTNGADPFWDAMRAGMQDAEKEFELAGGRTCGP